ncbi:hypothetical protein [Microbacterium sp. CGR2]|uniref:hypothetical protein n=1 Tax=Microbacterium sp. CGR2 TaxID=1805820 RepID=UPI000EA90C84|nr:hypothetical protein [Microbacterium sp. CGR2]RKN68552.1 hypothetical protein D7252_13820 [Microbacterium sp. CGR2]
MSEHKKQITEEREALIRAVQSVTWNASNYPRNAQPHILGQDVVPLTMRVVESVSAAGFRMLPGGEPSDEQVENLAIWMWENISQTLDTPRPWSWVLPTIQDAHREKARAALRAAGGVR